MGRIMSMSQLVMALALVASLLQDTAADDYVVGNASIGWTNTQSAGFYTTWASRISFEVGDKLVFNFNTGTHDVAIVSSKDAFDSCSTSNPNTTYQNGPATVNLTTTGPYYFICTFPGHCASQKLTVNVVTDNDNPSPPPPTGTTPPTTGTTPPTTTNTTSPPPPSSASPRGVAFAFVFMSLAIVFFCC